MLDVTDLKLTAPVVKDRAPTKGPCLNDLIAIARDAHLGVINAFTNAMDRAITCGRALNQMKAAGLVKKHGGWPGILKRCQIGDRQARRYRQLADLVEQNRSWKTEIEDCSIEAAIKKLAPPKPRTATSAEQAPRQHTQRASARKTTFADIIAAWMTASAADRTHALDAIGWNALRDAIPPSWHAILAAPVIDVTPAATDVPAIPGDLSIPDFLDRKH